MGLIKVLCHDRAKQHRRLDAVKKHQHQACCVTTNICQYYVTTNNSPIQEGRHRIREEAKEEIEPQLKEMMAQGIVAPK